MILRPCGHIPNLHDPNLFDLMAAFADPAKPNLVAAAKKPKEFLEMEKYILYTYDQKFSSACVGFTYVSIVGLMAAMAGSPLPRLSGLAAYTGGRWQGERALLDVGSRPADVCDFGTKHGVVKEVDWQLSEATVNKRLDGDILQDGESAKIESYYVVGGRGAKLIDNLTTTLASRQPLMIATQMDDGFQNYESGVIREMNSPSQGGHMIDMHGYAEDAEDVYGVKFRCHTSWGNFGEGSFYHNGLPGFFWLSASRVVQAGSDFMALQGVPLEVL